jgi:nicotinamidase-related amidase
MFVAHCINHDVRRSGRRPIAAAEAWRLFCSEAETIWFYMTPLELLLDRLDVKTVIVTGIAGNSCVLISANDAYMRELWLVVRSDCIVSNTPDENQYTLHQIQSVLKAHIR